MRAQNFLAPHRFLFIILFFHLALSLAYTSFIPLGEAPDEPAHLTYARFIADNGRLPASMEERREASYRSTWPPLYHLGVSVPLKLVGNRPPTRLKSVGDTPRRLIPTNGQTIAAFIHTADEAWPWRGITLAWHLGRLISVGLTLLTVGLTYAIAWRLTRQRFIAASATAVHAFLPQALFVGAVINDDNLLIFLSGLVLLTLISLAQRASPPHLIHIFFLGALLGLATIVKYNALPLWVITIIWIIWLIHSKSRPSSQNLSVRSLTNSFITIVVLLVGAVITGGWWFIFIWQNFNQVKTLGAISGSLASLSAGTADASLRQLSRGGLSMTLPPPVLWTEWIITFFKSFWGLFGGGSTIAFPGAVYGFLTVICLAAIGGGLYYGLRSSQTESGNQPDHEGSQTHLFILLIPLCFLPLPFIRFILSGNVIETAQGRHLFPALPLIAMGFVSGLSYFAAWLSTLEIRISGLAARITAYALPGRGHLLPLILPVAVFAFSLYGLYLIVASYPPPIPLRTTAEAAVAKNILRAQLTEEIWLIGYELGQPRAGFLPLTLVWQANAIPPEDYLIDLSLTTPSGDPLGNWIGHPIGGRYPTRAWDDGDILRDRIPIPIFSNPTSSEATLSISLLNSFNEVISPNATAQISLSGLESSKLPLSPPQLRADHLPPNTPFSYRSTLSFALPGHFTPPTLIAPNKQVFAPARFTPGSAGTIAHFIVAANWPSGSYHLETEHRLLEAHVINRPRRFEPPPMTRLLNANIGGQITILGYDLPQNRVQPGQSFPLTLHLQAQRTMGQNLIIFNHLLDAKVVQHGGTDRVPQNYYTTLLWVPGEIVSDFYHVSVDSEAPAGIYWLDIGLYPADQPDFSLPLFVDNRPVARNSISLGPIKVGGPPAEVTLSDLPLQNPIEASFGNEITLRAFNLVDTNDQPITNDPWPVAKGPTMPNLNLFWQAETIPRGDYTVFVHLLDPDGKLIAQADSPPAAGVYPTSLWDAGEIIADRHPLPQLAPGHYLIQVGLYRPETGERLPVAETPDNAVRLAEFEIIP